MADAAGDIAGFAGSLNRPYAGLGIGAVHLCAVLGGNRHACRRLGRIPGGAPAAFTGQRGDSGHPAACVVCRESWGERCEAYG